MDNETTAKKPGIFGKIGALWKSGVKGKAICIVCVLVILGIIGAFTDDENGGGGGGGGDWKYTGEYFDSVFTGFPKDEGVVYQHFPRDIFILSNVLVPIKVMQATKKGNLVELEESDRVIWVETKRRYEDDEPLDQGYYIRRGSMEYQTAMGAEKTVPRYVEVTGSLLEKVKKQIEEEKAAAEAKAKAEAEAEAKAKAEREVAIPKAKAEIEAMQAGTHPGETKTITLPGGATMDMVWCPAGTFMMGSIDGERDELPVHEVTLTKGFWLAKTEVTQRQWKSVEGGNQSDFEDDNQPVEMSWDDCQEFCKKMGLQLPTEAQWEYACRAGSWGDYAGSGNLDDMGWYEDNSEGKTHPVGQKQPNAWGLYDMHGNVREWCADWYGDYPDGPVTDPKGASSGPYRVHRGGSWCGRAFSCLSARRRDFYGDPSFRNEDQGFRPARVPEVAEAKAKGEAEAEAKAKAEREAAIAKAKVDLEAASQKLKAEIASMQTGKTAGETKTITLPGGVKMEMVWCPPGTFTMGSPEDEKASAKCFDWEETQHQVTLTKGFWMGKTEVTQAQWKSVMGYNPSRNEGDNLPVDMVNWHECQKFCEMLGLQLPTEAQWEYACRAGSTGPYAGSGNLDEMGWYYGNSGEKTHPVGQKKPNAWGLYDMHGNVCEWCADLYDDYPDGAVTDPQGARDGDQRVLRGGDEGSGAARCRSASRSLSEPEDEESLEVFHPGFRVARVLSE